MVRNLKVFIDSNVWFSFFWGSVTIRQVLASLVKKNVKVVVSELVLKEIVDNIELKNSAKLLLAKKFLLSFPLMVVKNPKEKDLSAAKFIADKKDRPILMAAKNASCNFLITGNLKDFKIKKIKKKYGLQVISPSDFLKKYER